MALMMERVSPSSCIFVKPSVKVAWIAWYPPRASVISALASPFMCSAWEARMWPNSSRITIPISAFPFFCNAPSQFTLYQPASGGSHLPFVSSSDSSLSF
ncbi:hypothetical protein U1Q18_037438 [Sarracenia purpurea var. burkii]